MLRNSLKKQDKTKQNNKPPNILKTGRKLNQVRVDDSQLHFLPCTVPPYCPGGTGDPPGPEGGLERLTLAKCSELNLNLVTRIPLLALA